MHCGCARAPWSTGFILGMYCDRFTLLEIMPSGYRHRQMPWPRIGYDLDPGRKTGMVSRELLAYCSSCQDSGLHEARSAINPIIASVFDSSLETYSCFVCRNQRTDRILHGSTNLQLEASRIKTQTMPCDLHCKRTWKDADFCIRLPQSRSFATGCREWQEKISQGWMQPWTSQRYFASFIFGGDD